MLLVGVGAIGERTAEIASALGMRVLGIRRDPGRGAAGVAAMYSPDRLVDLLPEADFVVLTVPLSRATQGMIGERELHAMKKSREVIDSIRGADIKAGRYAMPSKPAALYQYYASRDSVDASGNVKGASYLYVVYTPYATQKTTGITENPIEGGPWIMYPGKPWAHLMIAPQKTAAITVK